MQPVPRLLGDVGGTVQQPVLRLELLAMQRDARTLSQQLVDLPSLRNVLAHRIGKAERDPAEHDGQHRRAAGEMRSDDRDPESARLSWPLPWRSHWPSEANLGNAALPA